MPDRVAGQQHPVEFENVERIADFVERMLRVVGRNGSECSEAAGMVADQRSELLVDLAAEPDSEPVIAGSVCESPRHGEDLGRDPVAVHEVDRRLRVPPDRYSVAAGEGEPGVEQVLHRPAEVVRVHVNTGVKHVTAPVRCPRTRRGRCCVLRGCRSADHRQ